MAGRKLTEEEKAEYNRKMSLNRAAKEKAKAEKFGYDPKPKAVNLRSADEIMADIEKAKQDPKFQKRMADNRAAQEAKGTQANHHVTAGKNVTEAISKGASSGVLGIAVAGMAAFNTEAKRIANLKNQIN